MTDADLDALEGEYFDEPRAERAITRLIAEVRRLRAKLERQREHHMRDRVELDSDRLRAAERLAEAYVAANDASNAERGMELDAADAAYRAAKAKP